MSGAALWLVLAACGAGQEHPSTLRSLQTVGIVADPPELVPGEPYTVELAVADPDGAGAEVVVASCLPFEGRCSEEVLAEPSEWLSLAELPAGQAGLTVDRVVPQDAEEIFAFTGLGEAPAGLLALACAPGLCPIVDRVRDALESGEVPTALAIDIAQPDRWMVDLPVEGVSLTGRTVRLLEQRDGGAKQNPIVEARFPERDDPVLELALGGELELAFFVDEDSDERVYAYGYTTVGRFEARRERVRDRAVRHYLLATERGEGHVFVVFEDGEGGSAVWQRPVRVQ